MKLRSAFNSLLLLLFLAVLAGMVLLFLSKHHKESEEEEKKEQPESEESHQSTENVVPFDTVLQSKNGIVIQAVESAVHFKELKVQGVIISSEDLARFEKRFPSERKVELISEGEILIQITKPSQLSVSEVPSVVWVKNLEGTFFQAKQIFSFPRLDSHKRKIDFIYVAPLQTPAVHPGMILFVHLPVEPQEKGVFVPGSAVVLWQGKSWVYKEKEPGRFIRSEISTSVPVEDGWFVSKGLSAKEKIVVKGAQLILSQEFHSQIPEE